MSSDQTEPAPRPNLPTLTGLRFVAALMVFGRHVEYYFVGTRLMVPVQHIVRGGPAGVSFFFILSGFVLTWSRRPHDTPRHFYRRRVARICPNYYVAWILGGLVSVWIGLKVTIGIALACFLFVQAFIPHANYYFGMDGVSWSLLSCEAFFYLLFPWWVMLLARSPRVVRLLALAACIALTMCMPWITPALFPHDNPLWFMYIFPPVRLAEFLAGVILALEVTSGKWPRLPGLPVALLAIGAYLVACRVGLGDYGSIPVTASYSAVTVAPFVLLIGVAGYADLHGHWTPLRRRWAVALGEWSFAFYLLHFLVVLVVGRLDHHRFLGSKGALLMTAGTLLISLLASAALYLGVERPFERRLRAPARPAALTTSAALKRSFSNLRRA